MGTIVESDYEDLISTSYVNYAVSTIIDRAVPSIDDGLKPVQRRILYAMYDQGMKHSKPYNKTARVVGEVIGKYHPHGEQGTNDAIVVLARKFKKNHPLIDGQGNFGSIEGDGAAAQRYTECRLSEFAEDCFLSDLKYDTIDVMSNYDGTLFEPVSLPCKIPYQLVNDTSGIAVGMTTSIPPHNLGEVIDCAIYFLTHKRITDDAILKIIKGPDFVTGGTICNPDDFKGIFLDDSEGKLRIRGTFEFEKGKGKKKDRLVITEIPFTMIGEGIGRLLNEIASLVEDKTLPQISDIVPEGSEDDPIRIVLELKSGTEDIESIKNIIYAKTSMETTMGVNLLFIDGKTPRTFTYRSIIERFIANQIILYGRKYTYLLDRERDKCDVMVGLINAVNNIALVTDIIKSSDSRSYARDNLCNALRIKPNQADAILDMKLARLTKLDSKSLEEGLKESNALMDDYYHLVEDEELLKKEIIKELREIKKKYAVPRRTKIESIEKAKHVEKKESIPVGVLIDRFGYIKCVSSDAFDRIIGDSDDAHRFKIYTKTDSNVFILTDSGTIHRISVSDIPYGNIKSKGAMIGSIDSGFDHDSESIIALVTDSYGSSGSLVIATELGKVKKVPLSDIMISRRSSDYIALSDGDKVVGISHSEDDAYDKLILVTKNGYVVGFTSQDLPMRSRRSKGQQAIKLFKGDKVDMLVGFDRVSNKLDTTKMGLGTKGYKPRNGLKLDS